MRVGKSLYKLYIYIFSYDSFASRFLHVDFLNGMSGGVCGDITKWIDDEEELFIRWEDIVYSVYNEKKEINSLNQFRVKNLKTNDTYEDV
jgi:hypothetical protein